jgi:hypothetical protein
VTAGDAASDVPQKTLHELAVEGDEVCLRSVLAAAKKANPRSALEVCATNCTPA